MNNIEKYKYWGMLSDYDLDTVKVLIDGERWVYVGYVCQQALERQLKGMYVYYLDKEAPKTHNLTFLYRKIADEIQAKDDFQHNLLECEGFLSEILFYYTSDYPFSYKNIKTRFINKETALDLYSRTQKWITWLRQFQIDIGDTSKMIIELTEDKTIEP